MIAEPDLEGAATKTDSRTRAEMAWFGAIVVVSAALRLISLGADPMQDLDPGFLSDAGTWWKNPRLHALWGVWTIDDANFGLYTAPAYTVALRVVFGALGVGYAQGNLVSAVSGIVSVVLVYLIVRREASAKPALLAAALIGINPLTIAYDRAAYPESFQVMMMIAAVGAIVAGPGRLWIAVLGGIAAVIVVLSKPPGLVMTPIATSTWLAPWIAARWMGRPREFELRRLLAFFGAAALVTAIVGVLFLSPNADLIRLHIKNALDGQAALASDERLMLFASPLGFRLNGFFRLEWYLLIPVAAFGAARIARVLRTPVTTTELSCWIWLVLGLGVMGVRGYQQDRRFLFLIPALAMLTALAIGSAIRIGESAWSTVRARRIGFGVGAAVLALVTLFYVAPYGAWKVVGVARLAGVTLTWAEAGGLLLSAMAVACGVLAAWRTPRLGWSPRVEWQVGVAAVAITVVLARAVFEMAQLSRGLQQVGATIHRLTKDWPDVERVAVGWSSGTMTLETRMLALNHELAGPRAAERFLPQLEVYAAPPQRVVEHSPEWDVPGRPTKVECARLPIWFAPRGGPRMTVRLFVEPDRVAACQAAVRAGRGS